MTITEQWAAFRSGASAGEPAGTGPELFYAAVVALAQQRRGQAVDLVRRAHEADPGSLVFAECLRYLVAEDRAEVYSAPEAFTAFVHGGGNVPLYEATRRALAERYRRYRPDSLLDLGTGEGLALLPALTGQVGRVDVLEPAAARLAVTAAGLTARGLPFRAFEQRMDQFLADPPEAARWDLVQETFAMLSIPADERVATLSWLRERTERLLLVEFDVPRTAHPLEPSWFERVLTRYELGLAEYPGAGNLVRQGFLVPVLLDALRPGTDRLHTEQGVADWTADLLAAGFRVAEPEALYDYWWATAYLLEAN
ncbi:hypothetical protein [Kutzneria albida]|uniref:Methyltransferase domain-containing protein n=1 Tax=Kutzneria albida DSM 43870 TaxID=1449976 RepID=W5W583_9PSEU|nr:hypothetical protein [Kutzneria albida]AHH95930.1 hypothetical protein KALB_2562 [Kutzneria albida DSM 43870]